MPVLLSNVVYATGADTKIVAGKYTFSAYGTSIGQATVALQRKMADGSYLAVSAAAVLAAFGNVNVDLPNGIYRGASINGGTAPVGVYASLDPI